MTFMRSREAIEALFETSFGPRRFGRVPRVDDYDWEVGDEGHLVVWPEGTVTWYEFEARFGGWAGGCPLFLLSPNELGDYGAVLSRGHMERFCAGDWLRVGFLGRHLPRCMCVFGDDLPESAALGVSGWSACLALCWLESPSETLDEVLS